MYDLSCKQTLTSCSSIISKEVTSATATQYTLEKLNPGRRRNTITKPPTPHEYSWGVLFSSFPLWF